ncbi:adoMet-dependent rRNA methyltransferase Spb1p [[Candida] jaroonii]|uniref:AdoMet-dependent rRNA methyltransferase Spb1p n=1 Tax=[Candida] jaroonii TaxID=467808 RepID=A0ACA9Y1L2_9ASCO|nr:adoMet-dependent rRNA methyltransferase Spb1p [[Candida] jaroonii]
MGKVQKKNSKGRLDRYYHLAKEKGYRARSSFKIIQINEKYGHFLEKSKVVIDLCAAPGSWCQVASQLCPVNSLIIGVDIVPIRPLPNVITFQSDITTEDCRSRLRGHMKTWKADTVLHDGAPNVGLGWVQDAFTQSQLTLQALKLAVENLANGGTFITKIFRSKDYNNLVWVFNQLFEKVEATKPPASRDVSAEIFVVCKGFKAPKKLDPRLLDPKEVFDELPSGPVNNEAKIFNPEKKTRQRQGYNEGDYLLYHEMPLVEFVKNEDPINTLGDLNKLTIDKTDDEFKIIRKLKTYNTELVECLKDLKVLGRKDFKLILRFRKQARELLGLDEKEEEKEEIEVEPLTEDQRIDKELQELKDKQKQKSKREKKNKNELKQKEIQRMQMNMLTDMNIGLEASSSDSLSLFNLKQAEKTGELDKLIKGKKRMIFNEADRIKDVEISIGDQPEEELDSDDELEAQLDDMYNSFQERKAEKDANYRAKKLRGDENDEPWDGIKSDDDEKDYEMEEESDYDDDDHINQLIREKKSKDGLSKTAKNFFAANSLFEELNDEELLAAMTPEDKNKINGSTSSDGKNMEIDSKNSLGSDSEELSSDSDFEIVSGNNEVDVESDSDSDVDDKYKKSNEQEKIDIATVEAMTLAHQIALGHKNKYDLIEEGINRYSFRDNDLPEWFLDDEKKHSKITKPITKEASLAIKQKQKELNARPIKKVLEAKGRKKMRAIKRLEKLKKKSDLINEDGAKSERDKAEEISKLMRKLTKKQQVKPKVTLVVAKGSNKRLSGRPRGVKGKYKMVDGTMKNEQRALKRITKKHKK